MWIKLLCVVLFAIVAKADQLKVEYQWKKIDFEYPSAEERDAAIQNGEFIEENVIPVGLEVYKNRLFITLPRWKKGVPASLAFIDLNDSSSKSPVLKPYPSWSAHNNEDGRPEIVSPFRVRADACGHLWVLDTGADDIFGNTTQLAPTRLLVYDLHNDNLLRSYEFPEDQVKKDSFFASLAVEDDNCDNIFVYNADLGKPGLVVYSFKSDSSWRVTHHFFNPDPLAGNFSIRDINFQFNDGLFGLALSKPQGPDGETNLYFHPFSSYDEFMVPTKFLKDPEMASSVNFHEFKKVGSRGLNGQSNAEFLDKTTGVLFYTLPNLNAVACWQSKTKEYNLKSQGRIMMDEVLMEFPNDIKVDEKGRLWVLSDRLQKFLFSELDYTEDNFRILMAPVRHAIAHTACDVNTKPFNDVINTLTDYAKPIKTITQAKDGSGKIEATFLIVVAFLASRFIF